MTLEFHIPTTWNELTTRQLGYISELLAKAKEGDQGIYFAVVYHLFCPSVSWSWKGIKERYKFMRLLLQVPFSEILPYSEFIFTDLKRTKFPKSVKVDGVKYYGPADRLSNISIEELNFSYKFYYDWMTNKDGTALDRLVTTLYRPEKKKRKGDIREDFDMERITSRGAILPKLPTEVKTAIGFAYKGSVEYMFERYPVLFPKTAQKTETSTKPNKPGYQSLVPLINAMFMYENQPFGPRKETIKTNAYVFFDVAQETVIANRKREQESKRK